MSRIGNVSIQVPSSVTVNIDGQKVTALGPLGSLEMVVRPEIKVKMEGSEIKVTRSKEDKLSKSLHGLTRTLISNMVFGVQNGWEKKLELVGVGYRAQTSGEKITLSVGYSHPVEIDAPFGVKFAVTDNTKVTVSGFDKIAVGATAAKVRGVKPPEPYQGKGIRYSGEYVRRKAGKAAAKTGAIK